MCHVPDIRPAKSTQEAQEGHPGLGSPAGAWLEMFGRLKLADDMPGIEQSVIPAATGESPADGDFLN